jgi:choline dehydrogenase-like flavoprotein
METYDRTVEVRLTGDDLPRSVNRVDLDPQHVDEFGFPVARITRDVGKHEWLMYQAAKPMMEKIFTPFLDNKHLDGPPRSTPHIPDLMGDHQMGTCRMGDDREKSVVDRWCRLHDAPNVFVVDSSFMPTGLGLNPMVTVVANALRVGTFIADTMKKGRDPSK